MKTVFILEQGEVYEKGTVFSIHLSKQKAIEKALSVSKEFDNDHNDTWDIDDGTYWFISNGHSYLRITEKEVQE